MRVVAGSLGGRRLVAPAGEATRPTTDRVREALFSMLESRGGVAGARALDLYAGTGALGIEALSRGAAHATFVESARPALAALRENVRTLGLERVAEIVTERAERWSRRAAAGSTFDLVLCDPPWAELGAAAAALGALVAAGRLSPDARVVLEHAARDEPPPIEGLLVQERRRWGDTAVWIARRAGA